MATGIESNFKFDLGFHLCRREGMGVAGTNYRRDCDLSRHPNWYIVYNPKLNPKLEWCILNYPSQIISPILSAKRSFSSYNRFKYFPVMEVIFHIFHCFSQPMTVEAVFSNYLLLPPCPLP